MKYYFFKVNAKNLTLFFATKSSVGNASKIYWYTDTVLFSLLETREKYVQVLSPYIGKPDIFQHNSSGKSAAIFVNYWLLFQAYQ